jgi:hypothetical protein
VGAFIFYNISLQANQSEIFCNFKMRAGSDFPVETRFTERGRLYLFGHGNLKQLDNSENDMYVCLIHMALIRPHFSPKRCAVVAAVVSGPSKQVVWVQISQAVKCQEIFFKAAA